MIPIVFWFSVFLIFYTYAGYPLFLFLLAQMRPKPVVYKEYFPEVTLLIAAYNEEQVIAEKLENSLALDYPRTKLQIIIAADGSSDHTVDIVRSYSHYGVELSYSAARDGKMAAINNALGKVRGEIIVMSDANNIYNPEALRYMVAPFQDPTVGATGGAKKIIKGDGVLGESEGAYWKYESWIKRQETRLGCAMGAAGEANAIRRDLFVSPPLGIINDDYYLMMMVIKQGFRVVYVPSAHSYERISLSAADEVERRARIVAGRYQAMALSAQVLPFKRPLLVWQVVSHKYLRPLVPFFMIFSFAAALGSVIWPALARPFSLVWLGYPWNWVVFGSQILFYISAWLGSLMKEKGRIGKLFYLATFLINSNFAALQGLWRFALRRQNPLWQRVQRQGESNS